MTSEERFTKIENALSNAAEYHAKHEKEMAELRSMQKVMMLAVERMASKFDEGKQEWRVGIHTLGEAQQKLHEAQQKLHEAQRITEEKLHALIDTVDRIIRNQGGRA